jgi:MoxR-like ATPase
MSSNATSEPDEAGSTTDAVDQGNYEVLRKRLGASADALQARLDTLNSRRSSVFGGGAMTVVGSVRLHTGQNSLISDFVRVKDTLVVGYHYVGLKNEVRVEDIFGAFELQEDKGIFSLAEKDRTTAAGGMLAQPAFERDLVDLHRFYRGVRMAAFRVDDTAAFAWFQLGESLRDAKLLRWDISPAGELTYRDNRTDLASLERTQHAFAWKTVSREQYVDGVHPHVSIEGEVFVETMGGTLTIKIENNTATGQGIYEEPVEEPLQTLDDARIEYGRVGGILALRIRPYNEEAYRYFLYNPRTHLVIRADAMAQSCLALPEQQGAIFPGGYLLETGESRVFTDAPHGLSWERTIRSPNGEDVLFVYYDPATLRYLLVPYNLIRKESLPAIDCAAFTLYENGWLVSYRADSADPSRVHNLQVWDTPFTSQEFAAGNVDTTSFLGRIGNVDLVRGIADGFSVVRLARNAVPSLNTYEDLLAICRRTSERYHWLSEPEAEALDEAFAGIARQADLVIDEFRKVQALQTRARDEVGKAGNALQKTMDGLAGMGAEDLQPMLEGLTQLRQRRGQIISLRELRYVDLPSIDRLEERVVSAFDELSQRTVSFLQSEQALAPTDKKLEDIISNMDALTSTPRINETLQQVADLASGLEVISEVVAGLQVDDPSMRASILSRISETFGRVNRARALTQGRARDVGGTEKRAEYTAQASLLKQSISSAISSSDTPEKAEEQLARILIQVQEMEAQFAEFPEFLDELAITRDETLENFEGRKQTLVEERLRRSQGLHQAGIRTIESARRRTRSLTDIDSVNSFFATDPMVAKLRDLTAQLRELDDDKNADDLQTRLTTARQEAVRATRDAQELYEDGGRTAVFGRHRFAVNTSPLELTFVPRDEALNLHLTGTSFYEPITSEDVASFRDSWNRPLPSESENVYRAEYLAWIAYQEWTRREGAQLERPDADPQALAPFVTEIALARYDEGYERGVHDADATLILTRLLELHATADQLRYPAAERTVALVTWLDLGDTFDRETLVRRARSSSRAADVFGHRPPPARLQQEVQNLVEQSVESHGLASWGASAEVAARYLIEELGKPEFSPVIHPVALQAAGQLSTELELRAELSSFEQNLGRLGSLVHSIDTAQNWLEAYFDTVQRSPDAPPRPSPSVLLEAAAHLALRKRLSRSESAAGSAAAIEGLVGVHPRVLQGKLELRLDEFLHRLVGFDRAVAQRWRQWRTRRAEMLQQQRRRLRVDDYSPRVMTSFVRNRLIQEVYLPLIGDNFAKQMGASGPNRRTDQMGLLLLISPPGYGKTTLMEYVAARLGLVFMKINGPSLGHDVVSLDPEDAPNAGARQEIIKTNLAFEMADNVLLYIDDIQHTNPEFLQKFISLCDGQRKIEGVWNGEARTYDLRGRRFAVVMAGNPYTESGEQFQVPDMLANRADIYNLDDILGGHADAFSLSYIENALTSNPTLAPLATRELADLHRFIDLARNREVDRTAFSYDYSAVESQEVVSVLRRLLSVRDVLLKVNAQYIASASQADQYRAEPPFKLQGSYRNMAKLAEKVSAAMDDRELEALVDDHYRGESQTLTTGAEQNLLKLAELRGRLSAEETARWDAIKDEYRRIRVMGQATDDPAQKIVASIGLLGREMSRLNTLESSINAVAQAVRSAAPGLAPPPPQTTIEVPELAEYAASVRDAISRLADRNDETRPAVAPTPASLDPVVIEQILRTLGTMETGLVAAMQGLQQTQLANAESLRMIARRMQRAATTETPAAQQPPAAASAASRAQATSPRLDDASTPALNALLASSSRNLDQLTAANARMVELMDAIKLFLRHLNARQQGGTGWTANEP